MATIGFFCAYTPLPLITAAGLRPARLLPVTDAPERAGTLLHDNLCPHVKRVVDRALHGDLPPLDGVVVVASCDAMRRLSDAWQVIRPRDRIATLDIPVMDGEGAVERLAGSLHALGETLSLWSGRAVTADAIREASDAWDALADALADLSAMAARGRLPGGRGRLEEVFAASVTRDPTEVLAEVRALAAGARGEESSSGVPVFMFGNVLPMPDAFRLIEDCGCRVVDDDLCTGGRQLVPARIAPTEDPLIGLARAMMARPPCGRTIPAAGSPALADRVLARARACGAAGVVAHVAKFCDPYLTRIPAVRRTLSAAGLPLLVLEGDCTLRSLGQQRTRIEAFAEMLAGRM